MTRKTLLTILIAGFAGIVLTLTGLWGAGWLGSGAPSITAPATTAPATPPASTLGLVTLDPDAVAASGIVIASLQSATTRQSTTAVATVVDLSSLADLVSTASSDTAQWQAAQARSAASGATYARDKALYADNQNVSQAELQSAGASATADRASVDAARASLTNATFALEQQFGPVIGRWPLGAVGRSLTQRRQVLVQVSTPAYIGQPSQQVRLTTASGRTITAHFVSAAVRTDPRIQGASFFYVARADSELLAGATVSVALPQGPQRTGAVVPSGAVVVWQGESWAYQRIAPGRFHRVPVSTQVSVDGGYLDSALAPGSAFVISGAQLLLSQEMQPPPGAAPAGGDDDDG